MQPAPPLAWPRCAPQVALPGFTSKADAELWVRENYGYHMLGQTGANRRVLVDTRQGVLAFVGLRGQNVMYKNLRYGCKGAVRRPAHGGVISFAWAIGQQRATLRGQ